MNKWFVCLKHGTKYSADYVNKLFNMTNRHSQEPHGFACITEDSLGLDPQIKVLPLPKAKLSGWWYKPWVFSSEFPLEGTLLFLDLDIVIIKNIDSLWNYHPGKFCIIKDFNRINIPGWNKMNSSVFRLERGAHSHVWNNLANDWKQTGRMHGDQDWIYSQMNNKKDFVFWPDEWIQSYKWEVRSKNDIVRSNDNRRVFREKANPPIKPNTSILVFHGDPKPSEVEDSVIVDNWK